MWFRISTRTGETCRSYSRLLQATRRAYAQLSNNHEIYDVVCVGGGPAGLSLLAALSLSFY